MKKETLGRAACGGTACPRSQKGGEFKGGRETEWEHQERRRSLVIVKIYIYLYIEVKQVGRRIRPNNNQIYAWWWKWGMEIRLREGGTNMRSSADALQKSEQNR